ncbi:MerR family transcriptional regulator [Leifsonia kafniensis]|uniref:MerR family transcriptional regulator n=1 Tax=Leifsonia kafniensis TaxID=475957 RepID=A0ABP7KGV8_9MICO
MKIGELAKRTEVSTRLLRYYEEQNLLTADRESNGYRDYPESAVDRVTQIRGLIDAGIPTALIKDIIPCLKGLPSVQVEKITPEMIETLFQRRDQLAKRIDCLTRNRDAVSAYLAEATRTDAVGQQAG